MSTADPLAGLQRLGVRPPFGSYVRDLVRYRDFVRTLGVMQLRARNGSTALGSAWTVFTPLLLGATFYLVFGVLLGARADVDNYVLFLLVGVFIFTYSQRCLTTGATTITSNANILRSVNLPRAVFCLGAVTAETLAHLPALVVLLAIAAITGEALSATWLLLLPALILQLAFGLGLALLVARLTFQVADTRNVLPFASRIWLYFSGVFFTADRVPAGLARELFEANPMHVFITLNRTALSGDVPAGVTWWAAVAWGLGTFVAGAVFFWQRENAYGTQ